jgi:hypothetical protein
VPLVVSAVEFGSERWRILALLEPHVLAVREDRVLGAYNVEGEVPLVSYMDSVP